MDDKKKPPFNPNQSFETVGTKEDVKSVQQQDDPTPKKPKFDAAKEFTPVEETVKKKETTAGSPGLGGSAASTPSKPDGSLSEKNTLAPTLEKKNDLINKFFEVEYQDWAENRVKELQSVIQKDPSKKDQIISDFEKESTDKIGEFNETIGKFAKINQERFAKDHSGFLGTLRGAFGEITDAAQTKSTEPKKLDPLQTAFERGLKSGKIAETISAFSTAKPEEEKLKEVAALQKEISELPASEAYDKFNQSAGVGDALTALAENPVQIIGELTVESLTSLLNYGATRMAAGAAMGAAIGAPTGVGALPGAGAGVIAGLADTSLALEYAGSFMESLKEAKVDVTDPVQLKNAFENDELISEARSHALKKSIPIAIFDLISGGIAGKITSRPAKSLLKKIALGTGEFATQAAMGGTGEAAGQLASGEDFNAPAIIGEMIGELGTTPIEVSANLLGRVKPKPESEIIAPTTDLGKSPEDVIKEKTSTNATDVPTLDNSAEDIQSKVEQNETPNQEMGAGATAATELPKVTEEKAPATQTTQDEIQKPITETTQEPVATTGQEKESPLVKDQKGEVIQTALGARIEANETESAISDRVKKADTYVRRKIDLTDQEAKDLLKEWNDNEHAERVIRDKAFELKPGVRATLAANLYQNYKTQAESTTDQDQKNQLHEKAADIGIWAAQNLTKFGQETAIAGKIWKAILQDEDVSVIALERENQRVAKTMIKPIQEKVTQSKEQFDDQVRALIEKRVTEGVEQRLKKAKLITKEKKKEISDFFDGLKVAEVKPGELNDITRVIGANVWNGSLEAVKRAVLTGADLANAIQAGVDYISENYKGKDFSADAYKTLITPSIEKIIPKEKIDASEIDETQIETPGIKGKKKKDFINSIVDAHNEGTLTEEKFEELYAKKIGYKPYTSDEKVKIRELAKIIAQSEKFKADGREQWNKLNEQLEAAEKAGDTKEAARVRKEFETLLDKNDKLFKEAQVANKQMQEFARAPSDVYDTLITIIQGNLLTPLSLVTNVYSNTVLQPLRFSSTAIGSGLDIAFSELAKLNLLGQSYKDRTIDLVAANKGYVAGGWKGAIEGIMQLKTGTLSDEKALREIQSAFSPSRAIGRWAESDRAVKQKVNDYIEGTFGIPAEVMFRLLNMGDKPFRRAAEMARAYELGSLKGLKGNDLIGFIAFPDEQSQAEITKAGQEATFQQETVVSQGVQKGLQWFLDLTAQIPYVGGALKVIVKSQVPYVKTPLNIAIETVDYAVPPLTMARGIYAYTKGNKRQGNILIGKAIVGGMIIAGTRELFALGLLESDDDDKEKVSKRKEGRDLKYSTVPPNSINISALMRGLTLQGFERKDNDISVTFKKMGPMGILMDIHAKDMYSELQEEGKVDNSVGELFIDMFATAPRVASSALDQSFLRGTNSFLSAIQDAGGYNTEQWLINTLGSVTSVIIPNTIATLSKASDEYMRDTYEKDFGERLKNTYLTKIFLGGKVPPKINLWGERITGEPAGNNKYFYYLFDVTKFQTTDTDYFKYKLYKQWKDDAYNDDWLPTMPKRTISVKGYTIPLSGDDYALLAEYVGKARYSQASSLIRSGMSKEMKLPELKDVYSEGMSIGKERFLLKKGWKSLSQKALKEMSEK